MKVYVCCFVDDGCAKIFYNEDDAMKWEKENGSI